MGRRSDVGPNWPTHVKKARSRRNLRRAHRRGQTGDTDQRSTTLMHLYVDPAQRDAALRQRWADQER